MKLLANENIPLASSLYLISKGYDVVAVGYNFPGISDEEVMQISILQERTIITFDRDYGELIFKYNYTPPKGVIYLRFDSYLPDFAGKLIHDILLNSNIEFNNKFTVIDKNGIRQRDYTIK